MKTLIILDTNKLRSMNLGGSSYGTFEFGSEYSSLSSYIKERGLSDVIKIAIPNVSLLELLQQKAEQYSDDVEAIIGIKSRLSELLPGADISKLSLPSASFDCKEHLKPKMQDYVQNNELTILDIEEDKSSFILKEVLKRAIEKQPPFKKGRKSSGMGFQDVMIWESILHHGYQDYDKVFLFTEDSDFDKDCELEFRSKVQKEFFITPSMDFVQTTIDRDYASLIKTNHWRGFASDDYFKSHLSVELSRLNYVTVDGAEHKLIRSSIVNDLDSVEEPEDAEETDIAVVIVSLLKGVIATDNGEKQVNIKARTYVDDTNGIQYTEFEVQ